MSPKVLFALAVPAISLSLNSVVADPQFHPTIFGPGVINQGADGWQHKSNAHGGVIKHWVIMSLQWERTKQQPKPRRNTLTTESKTDSDVRVATEPDQTFRALAWGRGEHPMDWRLRRSQGVVLRYPRIRSRRGHVPGGQQTVGSCGAARFY